MSVAMSMASLARVVAVSMALAGGVTVSAGVAEAASRSNPKVAGKAANKSNAQPTGERGGRPGRRPPRAAKGVRQLFDDAQKLYDAGKYADALRAFDAIVRRYPGHEPAQLQLAKTLYRLDMLKEAYLVFARVNPQQLDPETSYEYAWSFYQNKQWQGALTGFQRVPKGHALFDLANYYGGICAIKLRRYEDAAEMLERAVVLPDKLAKSRALYIKHLQALTLMQQKATLSKEREAELQRLAGPKKSKKEKPKAPTPVGPYQHKGKKSIDRFAKLSYNAQHQYLENHGYKTTDFDAKISAFDVSSGYVVPLPPTMGKERQSGLGAQVDLGAADTIKSGEEARIIIDEDDADLSRVQSQDLAVTDTKQGSVGGHLWFELPLPENAWLAFGGDVGFVYPEFERGGRYGNRKGYGQVAGTAATIDYRAELSYSELLDTKTKPTTEILGGKAVLDSAALGSLSLRGTVEHQMFDYLQKTPALDGPDTQTHAELYAKQAFLFGFSASLALDYAQQQNYLRNNLPSFGAVSADGQTTTGKVSLNADPVPWLSLKISQSVAKTRWRLGDPAAREPFEIAVADYIEEFNAKLSLNLAF